jgi:hypothetical protein
MTLCLCWCTCGICWPHFFCAAANGLNISLPSHCVFLTLSVYVLFHCSYLCGSCEQLHVYYCISMFLRHVLLREHRYLASTAIMDVHVYQELGQSRSELVVWILHSRARAGSIIFPDKIAVRIVYIGLYPVIMHVALHFCEGNISGRVSFLTEYSLICLKRYASIIAAFWQSDLHNWVIRHWSVYSIHFIILLCEVGHGFCISNCIFWILITYKYR